MNKIKLNWNVSGTFEVVIILLLLVIGVGYQIPAVKCALKTFFFEGATDIEIMVTYFAIVVAGIVSIVFSLGKRMDKLKGIVENASLGIDKWLFYKGTLGIYDDVNEEIERLQEEGSEVVIDILGFTLFSLQNKFQQWKKVKRLRKITFNLFYISPDYIRNCKDIDSDWANLVESYIRSINKFKDDNRDYLKKNKVKINLYPFSHIPAIHGFRLNRNSIYASFSWWDDNLLLHNPADHATYIKILYGDTSDYSIYLKDLYDNWVQKAKGEMPTLRHTRNNRNNQFI